MSTSKMTKFEWNALLALTICFDVLQILLNLALGAGVLINRYLDIAYAFFVPLYLVFRDVPMDGRTVLLFAGSFVAEEIPLVDVAPAWTFDIWKIRQWNTPAAPASSEPEVDELAIRREQNWLRAESGEEDKAA